MKIHRRRLLALSSGVCGTGLAGCSDLLPGETPSLTLVLLNFDSGEHVVDVEAYRADADTYQESLTLRERYELPTPPEERAASEYRDEDALESDAYVFDVRLVESPSIQRTYHFYPALEDDDERTDTLFIEVRREPDGGDTYIEFRQNQ